MTDRTLLRVVVVPRSSRNRIALEEDGSLKAWLTAPPTDGQANAALCEMVAKRMHLPKSSVTVARGANGRRKEIAIEGVGTAEAIERLSHEPR